MARPRKEINIEQLKALMRLNPTLKDTAAFFECSEDTIERLIKSEFDGISYAAFREQNMVHTRMTLIRNALKMAEKGNPTMMIFCLKNLCGWKDRFEQEVTGSSDPEKKLVIQFSKPAEA
jgi:hypothetical protein